MKKLIAALLLSSLAVMAQKTPRPAPELSINIPNGKPILLSQYRGKVTIVELLITTCPHCQHAAQLLSKLQGEYGPKGFQAVGVAFNDMSQMLVPDFVRDFRLTHPIGYASRDTVYSFLQVDPKLAIHVPQLVIIDRKGVIRHQSMPREDTITQTEPFLRKTIESLLKEPGAAPHRSTTGPKKAPAKRAAS
jgi:thiol-disulfide isomerase/thioredoxin